MTLSGKVAVVTGSSRGAGRGIALALGSAGATVYVTGRTTRGGPAPVDGARGTVDDTADEVTTRGGRGVPVKVDLTSEPEVAELFARVRREQGRLDVLANAVWGGNEHVDVATFGRPFWEEDPASQWRQAMIAGPYAYLLASREAARWMAERGAGLIVHVTDGVMADGSQPYGGNLSWDLAHAAVNRLAMSMSHDLKPRGVAVVAVMPGFMRTERVEMHMKTEELKKTFRYDLSETPEYLGRGVAALAADPKAIERSGTITFAADLARAYCFTDVDGRQPPRFDPEAPVVR
ncbi:MAG TPA: SDR family NAD(P)-dependent oxidoreductase [Myxococcaceae bacterium]|jgi:NAD(P)-dependent dehydrogenase (short-subunit alcohol dehydrogenase family)